MYKYSGFHNSTKYITVIADVSSNIHSNIGLTKRLTTNSHYVN